jgi:hypothetical protein
VRRLPGFVPKSLTAPHGKGIDMVKCPFRVGDLVIYKPSSRGRGRIIMTDLSRLIPGEKYKIFRIEDDVYVVVEGFEHSIPSGLFWTEFITAVEN